MKSKKNKTCLRHRLLDVGTKHRESKRSKGPFALSTFCLSIVCPGLHLFWCLSIRSPDKAGDPLSLERMVHGNFFFLGKVAKIMWKQKNLIFSTSCINNLNKSTNKNNTVSLQIRSTIRSSFRLNTC